MAHMNQEKKVVISEALKAVVPADWKYSLSVKHHSEIVMTIKSAPIDLIQAFNGKDSGRTYTGVNEYHFEKHMEEAGAEESLVETFKKIISALNTGNYDHSDVMSDFFCVGFYTSLKIGTWDKPFIVK